MRLKGSWVLRKWGGRQGRKAEPRELEPSLSHRQLLADVLGCEKGSAGWQLRARAGSGGLLEEGLPWTPGLLKGEGH